MKKIDQTDFMHSISGIRLFRDDVDDIIHSMRQFSPEIELYDKVHAYDSIDDYLTNRGPKVDRLSISVYAPSPRTASVRIEIKKNVVWIFSHGSLEARNLALELKDFFFKKRPFHFNLTSPWIWWSLAYLSVIIDGQLKDRTATPYWIHSLVIILVLMAVAIYIHRRTYFGVYLRKRHEGGFWKRNRDQILLLLLGALIGIIGTLAMQLVLPVK